MQLGDSFYSLRAENAHGNMAKDKNVKEAIKHYNLALKEPKREEAAWKLLRAYYFWACFATPNDKERYNVLEKARTEGKVFWKEFPNSPDVAYWYSVNMSLWASAVNPLRALNAGSVTEAREIARMLIAQGERNKEAVARGHQILGRAHQVLPRVVVVLNWVNKDSVEYHYKKALSLDPSDIATRLFLADFYKERKRNQEFEDLLKPVAHTKPRAEEYLEDERNLIKMKKLLSDPNFSESQKHKKNLDESK
ncbi:MAG: tetratricopeptide repeat protein [Fibromonadales bacterium]|nr:tetratricopeptide repeat protein [Fibromonadales bacterium]